MLRLAEAGQVGVEGGNRRAFVSEIDLDLAEVLPLFQQMGGVGVAQGVDVRVLLDPAGVESQTEGALERGAAHRFGGGRGAQAVVAFGREQPRGMVMRFPLLAQELEGALGQRDVAIGVALAAANVEEHPLRIDGADFQRQAFAQAQAAGIDRGQGDPMIQSGDRGENLAHFSGREDHGQFELGLGANQDQFVGPLAAQGFLPKEFDRANGLGGRLTGDFLDRLEVDEVLADLFGRQLLGGLAVVFGELANTGVVSFLGAGAQGQQSQVIGEGI